MERRYGIPRTPVRAIDLTTGEATIFGSQGEAAKKLGVSQANICKVLQKSRSCAGNYYFERIDQTKE